MPPLFADASRAVIVAIDHPLYMWPVAGLEDRRGLIASVVDAGADGVIASYGTLRDCAEAFADRTRIMKLDLATVSVGAYRDSEFRLAWTLDDAARLGADAVLTFVQLGTAGELDALAAAARVAAAADRAAQLAGQPLDRAERDEHGDQRQEACFGERGRGARPSRGRTGARCPRDVLRRGSRST